MSTALTIGNFDGVHVGHAALVRRARSLADRLGRGRVVALAFDPHPLSVLRPDAAPQQLSTFDRRAQALKSLGADEVVRLTPTRELLSHTPEQFLGSLIDQYHPQFIVEGDDFRFGKGRSGDVRTLVDLGASLGFTADVVPPVEVALSDQLVVRASSSIVRWLITQGRVRDAALVLGRPYELSGTVVKGDQVGRRLGFPTANLATPCLIPSDGIYAGIAALPDGACAAAAINIGTRPTFNGNGRRAEAHLMPLPSSTDKAATAQSAAPLSGLPEYGWALTLQLVAWLRDDARFDSADSLVDQIRRDCDRVNRILSLDTTTDARRIAAASAAGKD
jgi:riboflavin kinase/FMN adenylyltransferase